MGTNIPRPRQRPKKPKMIVKCDGIIGEKTKAEILESLNTGLIYHDTATDPIIREYRTNCPNCCAVITGPICEYCGTRFSERYMMHRSTEGEEFIIPLNITGDQVEKTLDAYKRFQSVAHDFGLPIQKQR